MSTNIHMQRKNSCPTPYIYEGAYVNWAEMFWESKPPHAVKNILSPTDLFSKMSPL